jgi:serine/threonine protein kinase
VFPAHAGVPAPLQVILGAPYGQKIDIWSLGCIMAELFSGLVLFQNDSLATLLARVMGILGPLPPALLARSRLHHKFFNADVRTPLPVALLPSWIYPISVASQISSCRLI